MKRKIRETNCDWLSMKPHWKWHTGVYSITEEIYCDATVQKKENEFHMQSISNNNNKKETKQMRCIFCAVSDISIRIKFHFSSFENEKLDSKYIDVSFCHAEAKEKAFHLKYEHEHYLQLTHEFIHSFSNNSRSGSWLALYFHWENLVAFVTRSTLRSFSCRFCNHFNIWNSIFFAVQHTNNFHMYTE